MLLSLGYLMSQRPGGAIAWPLTPVAVYLLLQHASLLFHMNDLLFMVIALTRSLGKL